MISLASKIYIAGEVLTSDITYIPTGEGWLYLALTVDLGTRKVAGWSMDETMTEKLVSDALLGRLKWGRRNVKNPPPAYLQDSPRLIP